METQMVTRKQVIELAKKLPLDKLATWYEYGLFIQSRPLPLAATETDEEADLAEELAAWEAASDEDWLNFENELSELV